MSAELQRECSECQGAMSPIFIMDKSPGLASHHVAGPLEYRLPEGPGYAFGTGRGETSDLLSGGARYVKDPYLPKQGYLELRPDRAGWGVEMDTALLGTEDYVNWQRKIPIRPDGSTGYV